MLGLWLLLLLLFWVFLLRLWLMQQEVLFVSFWGVDALGWEETSCDLAGYFSSKPAIISSRPTEDKGLSAASRFTEGITGLGLWFVLELWRLCSFSSLFECWASSAGWGEDFLARYSFSVRRRFFGESVAALWWSNSFLNGRGSALSWSPSCKSTEGLGCSWRRALYSLSVRQHFLGESVAALCWFISFLDGRGSALSLSPSCRSTEGLGCSWHRALYSLSVRWCFLVGSVATLCWFISFLNDRGSGPASISAHRSEHLVCSGKGFMQGVKGFELNLELCSSCSLLEILDCDFDFSGDRWDFAVYSCSVRRHFFAGELCLLGVFIFFLTVESPDKFLVSASKLVECLCLLVCWLGESRCFLVGNIAMFLIPASRSAEDMVSTVENRSLGKDMRFAKVICKKKKKKSNSAVEISGNVHKLLNLKISFNSNTNDYRGYQYRATYHWF